MWIVQLRENFEFLCPSQDGDVTSTPYLSKAGVFEHLDSAIETADFYSGANSYYLIDCFNFEPTYEPTL